MIVIGWVVILNHHDDITEQTLRVFMMTTMMMLLMMTKLLKQRSNCNCITVQVIGPGSSANTIQVTDHHHHHHRFDHLDDFDYDEELRTPSFSRVFVYSSHFYVPSSELQKRANRANQLVLFFLAGANFWAILGHFWAILAILGHFWAIMGNFG